MNIAWFSEQDIIEFPNSNMALSEPDGLLAAGGNLSVATLTQAYCQGIFPWFEEGQPILWWSPSQRAIIDTSNIHIAKNLKKLINKQRYHIKVDTNFEQVIQHCCAITDERQVTWITSEMQTAYLQLFKLGIAHSIEVYNSSNQLVGGLYGVFIRNCFCGESMFNRESNTSKLALVALATLLKDNGCQTIDCQLPTLHLSSMGAISVARASFLKKLQAMQDNTRLIQQSWKTLWQL